MPLTPHQSDAFRFHPATAATGPLHDATRTEAARLAEWISDNVPAGHEQNMALDAVRTAMFWANAGIACRVASDLPSPKRCRCSVEPAEDRPEPTYARRPGHEHHAPCSTCGRPLILCVPERTSGPYCATNGSHPPKAATGTTDVTAIFVCNSERFRQAVAREMDARDRLAARR